MALVYLKSDNAFDDALADWLEAHTKPIIVNSEIELHKTLSKRQVKSVILGSIQGERSGYAVAEEINRVYDPAPKIILTSNESSIGEQEKAAYAGVQHLLIIPFEPKLLEELI